MWHQYIEKVPKIPRRIIVQSQYCPHSKILEKVIHKQVYTYLQNETFLSIAQSGLRKGHSTVTCLIDFLDGIYDDTDMKSGSGVLFLDLKKAFDTISQALEERNTNHFGDTWSPSEKSQMV